MRHLHAGGRGHGLPFGDKPIEKSNFTRRKIWLSEKPKKNLLPGLYYLALFLTFILYPRPPPIQSNRRNQYLRENPATPIHRRPGVALSAAEGSGRLHRIITTPKAFNCHSGVGAGASLPPNGLVGGRISPCDPSLGCLTRPKAKSQISTHCF